MPLKGRKGMYSMENEDVHEFAFRCVGQPAQFHFFHNDKSYSVGGIVMGFWAASQTKQKILNVRLKIALPGPIVIDDRHCFPVEISGYYSTDDGLNDRSSFDDWFLAFAKSPNDQFLDDGIRGTLYIKPRVIGR